MYFPLLSLSLSLSSLPTYSPLLSTYYSFIYKETFGQASGRPIVVVHQTMEKAAKVRETPPIPNILIANSRSGSGSESSVGTGNNPQSPISPKPRRRKLVVIGDGACGKTSLLVAYRDQTFTANYVPTVFENSLVSVPVENKTVDLALWDTAGIKIISSLYNHFSNDDTGQEDYDRLRPLSYPESNVILVCFAIDKPQSLANVEQKWVYELEDYCTGVPRILVGCKSDLRSQSPPSTNTLTTPSEVEGNKFHPL